MPVRLYDYARSGACYRVRIALALKGVAYEKIPVNLMEGDQNRAEYRARNPQGLVPMLDIDGLILTQSFAIIDYLDRKIPEPPLLPTDDAARAKALAMTFVIAADTHPIQNLRVLNYVDQTLGLGPDARAPWAAHWIKTGLDALEAMAPDAPFLTGDAPGLPDLFLVPQLMNARRFGVDLAAYPRLIAAEGHARAHPAFIAAAPPAQ